MSGAKKPRPKIRLGRKPRIDSPHAKRMALVHDPGTYPPVAAYDYVTPIVNPGVMKNDTLGDCGIAGLGHDIQGVSLAGSGKQFTPPDADIVAQYRILSPRDDGTNLAENIQYNSVHPLSGRKLLGFLVLNTKDHGQLFGLSGLFGGCYVGLNLPNACLNTNDWSMTRGSVIGGHCVYFGSGDAVGGTMLGVSWGRKVRATAGFFDSFCDEGYVLFYQDWLSPVTGLSPLGHSYDQLCAIATANGGTIFPGYVPPQPPKPVPPVPVPVPPTPGPAPVPPGPTPFDAFTTQYKVAVGCLGGLKSYFGTVAPTPAVVAAEHYAGSLALAVDQMEFLYAAKG